MKLSNMPYANARVELNSNGSCYMVSYTTPVIYITADGWLSCTGLYSMTTRKHIGAFVKEYAPAVTFQDVKAAFNGGYELNIYTLDKRPL